MDKTETLYDRIIRKLKNNKVIAFGLIGFVVVLGLAQLQGALSGIWTAVFPATMHIDAFIEKYDFLADVEEPKRRYSIQGDITHVQQAADKLAAQLTSAIGSASSKSEAILRIDGSSLRTTQSLHVSVIVFGSPVSPMAQTARITQTELGDANGLDLAPLFTDTQLTGEGGKSIQMEVRPADGSFERQSLTIFKGPNGLSFESDALKQEQTLAFSPHKTQVMLLQFDAKGASLEQASAELDSALRRVLADNPSFGLSGLTQKELEEKKKTIRNLGPGVAKTALSNQANVDYVITGRLW